MSDPLIPEPGEKTPGDKPEEERTKRTRGELIWFGVPMMDPPGRVTIYLQAAPSIVVDLTDPDQALFLMPMFLYTAKIVNEEMMTRVQQFFPLTQVERLDFDEYPVDLPQPPAIPKAVKDLVERALKQAEGQRDQPQAGSGEPDDSTSLTEEEMKTLKERAQASIKERKIPVV